MASSSRKVRLAGVAAKGCAPLRFNPLSVAPAGRNWMIRLGPRRSAGLRGAQRSPGPRLYQRAAETREPVTSGRGNTRASAGRGASSGLVRANLTSNWAPNDCSPVLGLRRGRQGLQEDHPQWWARDGPDFVLCAWWSHCVLCVRVPSIWRTLIRLSSRRQGHSLPRQARLHRPSRLCRPHRWHRCRREWLPSRQKGLRTGMTYANQMINEKVFEHRVVCIKHHWQDKWKIELDASSYGLLFTASIWPPSTYLAFDNLAYFLDARADYSFV